ncbi:10985_t:CDS:2 [Cetraspora pellucida]|uniref:10985_t:CDS:1 n=1 Tax=Cetraspora pellucida TaxID=1433469 RepID=A0ACA9NTM6_9GLOM|nr:10985_t:CDS:2 [Cetraspora pellucida]
MLITIKEIYQKFQELSKLEKIAVGGWVKSIRESKEKIFITLNDGSTLKSLQIIVRKNFSQSNLLEKINFASTLLVSGKLTLTPERAQNCELRASKIELVNPTATDYPFQKKNIPLEIVRHYPHLRTKTNYFLALFRLRHSISKAIHDFFHQEGFYYVPTPIITSNDAEGAGEAFTITTDKKEPFFSQPASLTVSGQLHAEALAQGLAEMAFADLEIIINLAEKMIKYVINYVLDNNSTELEYLENYDKENKKEIIDKLKKIVGMDLQSEHEKYLCQYFNNAPVFVLNFPKEIKAFYMKDGALSEAKNEVLSENKNNSEKKIVACFDLLFPEIGELIGGSTREDDYQVLVEKARKIGLDTANLA